MVLHVRNAMTVKREKQSVSDSGLHIVSFCPAGRAVWSHPSDLRPAFHTSACDALAGDLTGPSSRSALAGGARYLASTKRCYGLFRNRAGHAMGLGGIQIPTYPLWHPNKRRNA